MGFGGIGFPEIFIILVIALLVLGPSKTLNMAKTAGKMVGEVRRAMGDITSSIEEEERNQVSQGPPPTKRPEDDS